MIDYAKVEIPPECWEQLRAHPCLSFEQPVNVQTGEFRETDAQKAAYRGMTFTSFPSGRITLHGSWHKYHHNGTNWQDFTLHEFREAVRDFCETFGLDPTQMQLLQLEAGANVTPSLPTSETLRAFVCNGKGNAFGTMRSIKGRPLGLELYLSDYGLKVYDKGKQFGLSEHRLRYERKFTSWCKFRNETRISVLSDLLHVEAWQRLAGLVTDSLNNLVIREPSVDTGKLSPAARLFYADAGRPEYWSGKEPKERHKARARMRKIVRECGTGDLHEDLRTRIGAKLLELIHPAQPENIGDVFHEIPEGWENEKRGRFPTSVNDGKYPLTHTQTERGERAATSDDFTMRKCRTCGRDITNQRPGSIFCSERLHGRAAKRCRNADSNPRNHDLRTLQRITANPLLFDHSQYLRSIRNEHQKLTGT